MGLLSEDKRYLIDIAHRAVRGLIEGRGIDGLDIDLNRLPPSLMERKGVFVTIYSEGELKGCMGTVLPVLPLWQACMENARSAAYKDPRFVPIAIHELDHISFEITIVDMPRPLSDISQLEKGIHGLILIKGFSKEVFLPGSLKDLPHDIEEIFARLRAKADMNDDDHDAPEQWELFDAEVISERTTDDGRKGSGCRLSVMRGFLGLLWMTALL